MANSEFQQQLDVYINAFKVATLRSEGQFRHTLSYQPDVPADSFVGLLMPVRAEPYVYDSDIHPVFRMNLPEGYLLKLMFEMYGPHIGGSAISLLSLVGRHGIGRIKLYPKGAKPSPTPQAFELKQFLKGDNSEQAFDAMLRENLLASVSGVVPKYLAGTQTPAVGLGKAVIVNDSYIIKGSVPQYPGIAINEHLCMQIARGAGFAVAKTHLSEDGMALAVERFDLNPDGTFKGMEDMCSLLALLPENKYQSTWEKVAKRITDVAKGPNLPEILDNLANLVLLNFAVKNADCHTKNIALIYSSVNDIHLSPIYDVLTTTAYQPYHLNSPSLSIAGRKSWAIGPEFDLFLRTTCKLKRPAIQTKIQRIEMAMAQAVADLQAYMEKFPWFEETGKRMLLAWREGLLSLRMKNKYQLTYVVPTLEELGLSQPKSFEDKPKSIGKSELPRF